MDKYGMIETSKPFEHQEFGIGIKKDGKYYLCSDADARIKELKSKLIEVYESRPNVEWFDLGTWIQDNIPTP